MTVLIQNFRKWWQPPRNIRDREEERTVTFLELFYDLVYVILIAELAHTLAEHVNLAGVGGFVFMFVTVWVAWFNGTMYHDLHGNDDIRTRIFTFLQMFTVAAMAVFAHSALGEGSAGFALSFAAYQLVLTYLWWRTGVHDPDHRPLSRPYSGSFLISTLLFFASAFVSMPSRFYLWGMALFLSLVLPLFTLTRGRDNPNVQAQIDIVSSLTPSAVERFGLLNIIVLGEIIVGVVRGVAGHHHLSGVVGGTAALCMLIAIGIWWIYFDFVSQRLPIARQSKMFSWLYLHLLTTIGIVATGAAVFNVVEHTGEPLSAAVRWLLGGAIATVLISIALLMRSIQIPEEHYPFYRRGGIVTLVLGLIILLLGFSGLNTIPLLIIILLLLLIPILYGVMVWIRLLGGEEITLTEASTA